MNMIKYMGVNAMNERILSCKLCGGKVSSHAASCPHCGSRNFKPDSYLREEQAENDVKRRQMHLASVKTQLADYGSAYFPVSVPYDIVRANFPDKAIVTLQMEKTTPHLELGPREYFEIYIARQVLRNRDTIILPPGKYTIDVHLGYKHSDGDFVRMDDKELKITVTQSTRRVVIEYGLYKGLLYGNLKLRNVKARVE